MAKLPTFTLHAFQEEKDNPLWFMILEVTGFLVVLLAATSLLTTTVENMN
jgi:hypothetical protein